MSKLIPLFLSLFLSSSAFADTVKLGVIAPLTGVRADAGSYIKNGFTLARDEINSDGTRRYKLTLIFEDDQYQPALAVTAFHKLKNIDFVQFVAGAHGSSVALALKPLAERTKTIVISVGAQADEVTGPNGYVFRILHSCKQEAPFLASFIASRMDGAELNMLTLQTAISPSYLSYFIPALATAGKKPGLHEEFDPAVTDFRPQLLKFKAKNTRHVFLIATPKHAGVILRQAAEIGLRSQFYNIAVESPETAALGGRAAEGFLYAYSYDNGSADSSVRRFAELYEKRFGEEPDTTAANSYDAAYILADCLEKSGADTNAVRRCFYQVKEYHGASGKFSIDENGDAVKEMFIKTIRDGKAVRFE